MSSPKSGTRLNVPSGGSASGSLLSISNLDELPFIHRRRQVSPSSLLPCLVAGSGVFVIALTAVVVYLIVCFCIVQQELTNVQLQLTSANRRIDAIEKNLTQRQLSSNRKENRSSTGAMVSGSSSSVLGLIGSLRQKRSNEEPLKSKKQNASKSTVNSASKSPSSSRDRNWKRSRKDIRFKYVMEELDSLRTELAHPSAHMVLPETSFSTSFSKRQLFSTPNYAVEWKTEHNAIFDVKESTHFVVKTPGTYSIYLQITYLGQMKKLNPTCSHIVMLENPLQRSRTRPLLYGSTTQYKLGDIISILRNGDTVKAIDSVYVSGVFPLEEGDRLYVKPDEFSQNCIVSSIKDKTFFGAFRLQSSFHE